MITYRPKKKNRKKETQKRARKEGASEGAKRAESSEEKQAHSCGEVFATVDKRGI